MLAYLRRRLGGRAAGDSVLTARLLDAFAQPGCPLCRVLTITAGHHLEALLEERVTLPHAHRELHDSRGFCGEHAWALPPASLAAQSARGAAMLHAPLLARLLERWQDPERRRRWLVPERPCPLCAVLARSAPAFVNEFATLLRRGSAPALATTPCLPHLRVLAPHLAPETRAHLLAATERARRAVAPTAALALAVGYCPRDPFPAAPTCPVCAAATTAALALPTPQGLCRAHAWEYFTAGRRAEAAGAAEVPKGACPACRAGEIAADTALATHQPAHRLCLGHLRRALGRDWLDLTVAYWSLVQLERDLTRFIASGSATTFTGTLTAGERRSWIVAIARFGGESPGTSLAPTLPWWPDEQAARHEPTLFSAGWHRPHGRAS